MEQPKTKRLGAILPHLIIITLIALVLRFSFWQYETSDMHIYLLDWFNVYKTVPLGEALRNPISNYSGPYTYLLFLGTLLQTALQQVFHLQIPDIAVIKSISILFDFLAAGVVVWILNTQFHDNQKTFRAAALVLFYPLAIINSSFWGQCDMIYTTFLLLSLGCLLRQKPTLAVICFAAGFSIKFQAAFFLPLLLLMLLDRRIRWFDLFWIPAVYLLMNLPSLIAGRPLFDVLFIYFSQAQSMPVLTANAANLYQLLPAAEMDHLALWQPIGLALTVLAGFFAPYFVHRKYPSLRPLQWVQFAVFTLILMPFVMPSMLDRYFFAAEIAALLLVFFQPRRWYYPLLLGCASLAAYVNSIFFMLLPLNSVWVKIGAFMNFIVLCVLCYDLFLRPSSSQPKTVEPTQHERTT
ncbi:MAG: DUF2029 domain-containing protein [Anaerolineaceae bacterium]|nr:DUF2029 domain-containing protein [Anaerolineaceae bacterium]